MYKRQHLIIEKKFLILITQAENITQGSNTKHYVQPHVNYNYNNYNANYKPQLHNTHTPDQMVI